MSVSSSKPGNFLQDTFAEHTVVGINWKPVRQPPAIYNFGCYVSHCPNLATIMSNQQLIVFDFDWYGFKDLANIFFYNIIRSMADQDTDRWIFEVLAPEIRRKMKELKAQNEFEWNDLV